MAQLASGERAIARIAGFVGDVHQANVLAQRLADDGQVDRASVMVLRPEDGRIWAWFRVRQSSRALIEDLGQSRSDTENRVWGALAGALVVGLVAWGLSLSHPGASMMNVMQALVMGAVWGALLGALAVSIWQFDPRAHRFERAVRRELRAGAHAVLGHDVPRHSQTKVMMLVRAGSDRWCAEAPRRRITHRRIDGPIAPPPAPIRRIVTEPVGGSGAAISPASSSSDGDD